MGSSQLVQILLEAGASVMPVKGARPLLFLPVLDRHQAVGERLFVMLLDGGPATFLAQTKAGLVYSPLTLPGTSQVH